jgi:hydroxymethylglutaryl-CoA lyase
MKKPKKVTIIEVGTRDGLQMEKSFVPTDKKIQLVNALTAAGIRRIEVTSFVSPKVLPQLSDAHEVMTSIHREPDGVYIALVPNLKGTERALAAGSDGVKIVLSAGDAYNRRNVGMSVDESIASCGQVLRAAKSAGKLAEAVIALAFGCPFEGSIPEERVLEIAGRLVNLGYDGLSVADSMGTANPEQVRHMIRRLLDAFPNVRWSVHLHNTRGLGLAHALVAWEEGIDMFDSSIGGLGGSAVVVGGASGNISTEDAVNMFHEMGVQTGINMDKLQAAGHLAEEILGHGLPSYVLNHGTREQFYERLRERKPPRSPGISGSRMSAEEFRDVGEHYRAKGLGARVGFGTRPAVLVVDLYRGSIEKKSPLTCDLEKVVSESVRILEAARKIQIPVLFTVVEYDPEYKEAGLFISKVPSLKFLVKGSRWVELDPRLGRRPEEPIVTKHFASAFFETALVELLHAWRVNTLVITGCTTSGCVRATVVDALQNGFRAIVPEGAVGDRSDTVHAANLFDMDAKYGDVVSVADVLDYFQRIHSAAASVGTVRR